MPTQGDPEDHLSSPASAQTDPARSSRSPADRAVGEALLTRLKQGQHLLEWVSVSGRWPADPGDRKRSRDSWHRRGLCISLGPEHVRLGASRWLTSRTRSVLESGSWKAFRTLDLERTGQQLSPFYTLCLHTSCGPGASWWKTGHIVCENDCTSRRGCRCLDHLSWCVEAEQIEGYSICPYLLRTCLKTLPVKKKNREVRSHRSESPTPPH